MLVHPIVQLFCSHPTVSPYDYGLTTDDSNFYIASAACSVKCPPPIYADSKIKAVWGFYQAFTVISWILLLILIVTYTKFRERRERHLLYCFLICCWMCSTTGLISVFKGPFNQICHSEAQDVQGWFATLLSSCLSLLVQI
jgi:hypothetical protein